jgi:FixJ family two-component response regulator
MSKPGQEVYRRHGRSAHDDGDQHALGRHQAPGFGTPVILVGHGDGATAVEAIRHGSADFLQKPIAGGALAASIHRLLRDKTSTGTSGRVALYGRMTGLMERLRPNRRALQASRVV